MLHSAYACCASCTPLPTSLNSPRSQGRTSIRDDIRKHKPLTSEITSQRKRSDFGFKLAHDLDSSATFSAGLHLMCQTKPRSSHINVRALSGESTAMISRRADRHIYTERTSCRTLINYTFHYTHRLALHSPPCITPITITPPLTPTREGVTLSVCHYTSKWV